MGGLAFSRDDPPLSTPRMSETEYKDIKKRCTEALGLLFEHVLVPIEGPGKTTFGDLDVIVAGPLFPIVPGARPPKSPVFKGAEITAIAQALGANKVKHGSGNDGTAQLAVPWPEDLGLEDGEAAEPQENEDGHAVESSPKKYIQVDLQVCDTVEECRWQHFCHCHGDFWMIFNSAVGKFGINMGGTSMCVRIEEYGIESKHKKLGRVPLTRDPTEILGYLDLDAEQFWRGPFSSPDDMFDFIAASRFFCPRFDALGEPKPWKDPEADLSRLKHSERKRFLARPVWRQWFTEYMPKAYAKEAFADRKMTRRQVREEAVERFGSEEDYQARIQTWKMMPQNAALFRQETTKSSDETNKMDSENGGPALLDSRLEAVERGRL